MRLAIVLPFLFLAALGQPNPPKPPQPLPVGPASPLVASRVRLCPEPDRDGLLAWSYDGDLPLVWTLGGKPVTPSALSITENTGYDPGIHGWLTLPAGLAPGTCQIDAGRGPDLAVTVAPVPKRKQTTIPADISKLRQALAAGFLDVTIQPGTVLIDATVVLSANLILRCDGVTFRRTYTGNPANNWAIFAPGQNVSIYGATFLHDRAGGMVFTVATAPGVIDIGLVLADCTFKRCNLGYWFAGLYCRDCEFDHSGCVIGPSGLYLRCRFRGTGQDPMTVAGGMPALALVDCEFDGTNRGLCVSAGADWDDFLGVAMRFRNVNAVSGGDELLLVEGPGVARRLTVLHTDVRGCDGTFCQFDHAADSVYVRDYFQDGGFGFLIWGDVGCTNITVRDFELRNGAGVWAGAKTTNLHLLNGQVFGWCPTRGSSHFPQPSPVALGRTAAIYADPANAAVNTLTGVRVETAAGYVPVQGFTVRPVP